MNFAELTSAIKPVDLRSCLISQDGQMLYEYYRNQQIPQEIAKVNSCTKSILSALICIAMDRGIIPEANTPIATFFPRLLDDPDPRKREITIEHLLTMTAGFSWTEFGGQKSFPRMTRSSNWIDFVLEQPLSEDPGTRMEYSSGVSQLLSAILVQASGKTTARFAEEEVFGPLGIEDYTWEADPQGIHTGGYGMRMRPADMHKFGQLYLQQGRWGQAQLISAERLLRSVQPAIPASPPNFGLYGWHWWTHTYREESVEQQLNTAPSPAFHYYYARGYAGQYIYIVPSLKIVAVTTDDKRKKERHPANVFLDYIAPILLKA
ncbi:serine hydrolase domain-containing protein [Paenibacillus radicis (ex Gao et al. 2016)]|uniref:6-aminohexanoate-dimer hydrolase n=1 Tax=Paenibacillus radicis (ex Gao et al. 2016) TaxID=1737354 RepID=A0A917H7E2_9BACL|nr:serine hydrolase [Paenibacillus radicis (ex Gao et al. 2016)]GGG68947.1 6-aminohexanoate-dimer hydrolase [Paenibacillus radicis (ex Gao et al. 2016)]